MQRRNILLAVTAGLLTLGMIAPAYAEKPPSWAIGTFSGTDWKGNRIQLTFERDGDVKRILWRNGRPDNDKGFYRGDGKFTFDGESWQVEDTSRGIKVDKKDDGRDWITLEKGESNGGRPSHPGDLGNGGDNRPPRPGQNDDEFVPTWAWGEFEGRSEGHDVKVNINRTSATIHHKTRNSWNEYGRWRDGYMNVGRKQYRLERNGRGVTLINRDDRSDVMRLSPVKD